jgi:hypothetical protein
VVALDGRARMIARYFQQILASLVHCRTLRRRGLSSV